jgi:hypothetical protein
MAAAPVAQAIELGVIRPLQVGPIGDSPQFADIQKYEAEAAFGMTRSYGKLDVNDDPDQKVDSSALRTRVAVGGGMAPSKNLALTASLDVTLASDSDEEQTRGAQKSHLDTGRYEHELSVMGLYHANSLVFGGGIGLKMIGSETREFEYGGADWTSEVSTAAMPVLRLFGGFDAKDFAATLGLRVFSMGEATVEAKDSAGNKYEYDIQRRNPGELHADSKLKLGKEAELAASIAYVLTGQASEDVDEFSMQYETSGGKRTRRLAGRPRSANHLRLGLGGKFQPNKMIGLLGGLSYIGASYEDESSASLEHENLGGFRLDLGTDVLVDKFRGFFHVAYALDSRAEYEVDDDTRGADRLDRTQRAPLAQGDEVDVTQGSWQVLAGGGIQL